MTSLYSSVSVFFFIFFASFVFAKFHFEFSTQNSLSSWPSCSRSGIKTIHFPEAPQHFRLHFQHSKEHSASSSASVEFFDPKDNRIARLELSFALAHVQLNWNGLISSWQPLALDENSLEIHLKEPKNVPSFILNGKRISSSFVPEQETKRTFKLVYDELAEPDADFLNILEDQEIASLLTSEIIWKAPLSQILETTEKPASAATQSSNMALSDYLVVDEGFFTKIQISSGKPLPKLSSKSKRKSTHTNKNKNTFALIRSSQEQANERRRRRFFGSFIVFGFIVYLLVLLKLSKMSSKIERSTAQELKRSTNLIPSDSLSKSASSTAAAALLSKSPSKTLALTLPSSQQPILISASNNPNESILKISVNLADNRHILFPSKLRNFQK